MGSFIHLLVEVIEDAQILTGFGNAKLDILFQIGLVINEAAGTLEFDNHEDGIADAAQGEKVFRIGEVLYITERKCGLPLAQSVLALVESLPVELLDASRDLVLEAAHVKAHHVLSYADAFAVAAARGEQAIVLTGDPEFETVEDLIKVEWLKE